MKFKKRKVIFGAMGFVLFALVAAIGVKGVFSGRVLDIYNPVTGEKRAMLHDDPYFEAMDYIALNRIYTTLREWANRIA